MLSNLNFLIDVDGVLTTGQFFYTIDGKVMKEFGPHDSYSLSQLNEKLDISFITADHRGFQISKKRIEDMGFDVVLVKEEDRIEYIKKNYSLDTLIFMGDSDVDAEVFKIVYTGIAPSNARHKAKQYANFVTEAEGGKGAVAEACDWLLENILK
tara:strand:- start:261 stop:722 length:462 start_codon:yes stop_codon:yes gene_type:complete